MRPPDGPSVAIIEDDPIMGESLTQRLKLEGYAPHWWTDGATALPGLRVASPDLLVCDIRLPDLDGEELYARLREARLACPVIFMTAFGDIDQAVRLLRAGAEDYITKPFDMRAFLDRVARALPGSGRQFGAAEESLGESRAMRAIEAMLRRVADVDSTVMITGESGAGKDVAARFLHHVSARANQPFMAVNCAAIPDQLIESELFGHEKGSFTGAHARHIGYAERARDGILFLDEVSELSGAVQAKLLRLVQDRVFQRVGGEKDHRLSARVVCATNANLAGRVAGGLFREDLYYRLNVIPVEIPSLRDRPDDVSALLDHFVAFFATSMKRTIRDVTPAARSQAMAHDWPGNVRELRNRVERAIALVAGNRVEAWDLFPDPVWRSECDHNATLADVRDAAERHHIATTLADSGGQAAVAAKRLGVSRTTLWEKMKRLGLTR